jgi:hypothetical protein
MGDGDPVTTYHQKLDDACARLLSWFKCARDSDIHPGERPTGLRSISYGFDSFNTIDSPPPHPDAVLDIGTDGAFWLLPGPPPRRIPIAPTGSRWEVHVENAPETHMGTPITDRTPVGICRLAIEYYEMLVVEVDRDWMT